MFYSFTQHIHTRATRPNIPVIELISDLRYNVSTFVLDEMRTLFSRKSVSRTRKTPLENAVV